MFRVTSDVALALAMSSTPNREGVKDCPGTLARVCGHGDKEHHMPKPVNNYQHQFPVRLLSMHLGDWKTPILPPPCCVSRWQACTHRNPLTLPSQTCFGHKKDKSRLRNEIGSQPTVTHLHGDARVPET